jgi:hypothetical protein
MIKVRREVTIAAKGDVPAFTVLVEVDQNEASALSGDESHLGQIVQDTMWHWYHAAILISAGKSTSSDERAISEREHECYGVSVEGLVKSAKSGFAYLLRLTDQDKAQDALDIMKALSSGNKAFATEWGVDLVAPSQPAAGPGQQAAPPSNSGDVVIARRAPSSTPAYTPGQRVQFTVNKIEASANNGVAIWKLWSPVGKKYPIATIYRDNQFAMDTIGAILVGLNLSLEKPSAAGLWDYLTEVNHAVNEDGKTREFFNPLSLKQK